MNNIERARAYLLRCEAAVSGQNGHNATFRAACKLRQEFGLSETDSLTLLREYNKRCIPPWSDSDLRHKLSSAPMSRPHPLTASKPWFNPQLLREVAVRSDSIGNIHQFLFERSPEDPEISSIEFLNKLYTSSSPVGILIFNQYRSQGDGYWISNLPPAPGRWKMPRAGKDGLWFLPQPVTLRYHPNPRMDGKLSMRSEEAVTAFRYLVIESDVAEKSEWLKALVQLPLPIASICDSGGRSIHALVRIDAKTKREWESAIAPHKALLVQLGADRQAITAVRLTRLPQALRGEKLQKLLYLDPNPKPKPIVKKAAVRETVKEVQ
jgi:hypothetical protein